VTAEYATGMIRTTFTAMPARRLVLAAKAATAAAFVLPIALVCSVVSFGIGQQLLAGKHLQVALSQPGVLKAIVFGAVAVSLIAMIGVGLGGVIRHTAGSTTALAFMILGSVTLGELLLPAALRQYLPGNAIQAAVTVHRSSGLLTPGAAIALLGAYAVVALAAAMIRVRHSDA
jgi:ABC-2 type transport system permease protein